MKIESIYHSTKDRKQEFKGEPRLRRYNKNAEYHPMLQEREYVRALNAVKIERMFAKPFVAAFSNHGEGLWCIAKDVDTPLFATGSYDNKVSVWDIYTREMINEAKYEERIASLAYNTEDGLFVSQGNSVISKNRKYTLPSPITAIDYSNALKSVAVGSTKGVFLFDTARESPKMTYTDSGISVVKLNPSFRHTMGAVSIQGCKFYDNRIGKEFASLPVTGVNCLEFNPQQGYTFSVGSIDCNAYLYDFRELNRTLNVFRGHVGSVVSLAYSPDGRELATGSFDHTIRIFGLEDRKSRDCYYNDRMNIVYGLAYSNDANFIVSGSDDGSLRLWKSDASKKSGPMSRYEKEAVNYREALKSKYKNVAEVARISKHRFLPKELKHKMRNIHEAHEAAMRRDKKINVERESNKNDDKHKFFD